MVEVKWKYISVRFLYYMRSGMLFEKYCNKVNLHIINPGKTGNLKSK